MATPLRIIALTEPEYEALKQGMAHVIANCPDVLTPLMERADDQVRAAVYHRVPVKAYEVARTDQQHNVKRIRSQR